LATALAMLPLLLGPAAAAAAGPRPAHGSVLDLGTLGGGHSRASAVNDAGQVAGAATVAGGALHAFLWSRQTGMRDLGTLGGEESQATAINARGDVAGTAQLANGCWHAFRWSDGEGMRDLGGDASCEPYLQPYVTGLNARGDVVGVAPDAAGEMQSFRWTEGEGLELLAPPPGFDSTWAVGVNDLGQVAGTATRSEPFLQRAFRWSYASSLELLDHGGFEQTTAAAINSAGQVAGTADRRAALWSGAALTDLGTLGGSVSAAFDLTDSGAVVGGSSLADGRFHAFRWTAAHGMTDLSTSDVLGSHARVGNGRGDAAGVFTRTENPGAGGQAFCWTRRTGMTTLESLGQHRTLALDLNAVGQVVGAAATPSGQEHAVLWTC